MKKLIVMALIGTAASAAAAALILPALAEGQRYPAVTHEATLKECSACHIVFQPQMLPARSWEAVMAGLDDHFGENAALDPKTAEDIKTFLVANAADAKGVKSRWTRGLAKTDAPLRISETPYFRRAHNEVSAAAFKRKEIGSAANCAACHKGAEKGLYMEPGEGGERGEGGGD